MLTIDRLLLITRSRRGAFTTPILPIALVLLTAALALVAALHHPPIWTIDVGAPNDTRFIAGVLPPQTDRETGVTFRWSRPTAQIRLHGTEFTPVDLTLHMHHSQAPQAGARYLWFKYGDRVLSTLTLAPGWRTYHILLPETPSDARLQAAPLTLATTPLRGGTQDRTQRGVVLDWMRLHPLQSSALPGRALALTWGLAIFAGWLWRIDKLLFSGCERLRWLRISGAVGIFAAGLVWWASCNPYLLAWALPELPWSLSIATGLLIAAWIGDLRKPRQPSRLFLATAVGVLIGGQALLNAQTAVELGGALALCGLALLLACDDGALELPDMRSRDTEPLRHTARHSRTRASTAICLGTIFLLALGLRWYRIADLPYGLWRDEARHGLEAVHMLTDPSYRPVYILGRVDLPGFGMYPFALAIKLWGVHVWSMRVVTGLAGALTVFPLYALVRILYGRSSVALLAAALLAVSSWHVTISRFSFPTIFDPLLQLTGLWLLAVGLKPNAAKIS